MELSFKPLLPPWWYCPEYERESMGWRMGAGEGYMDKFCDFFGNLSLQEKRDYCEYFHEPPCWSGFYRELLHAEQEDFLSDDCDECFMENGSLSSINNTPFVHVWQEDSKPLFNNNLIAEKVSSKALQEVLCFKSYDENAQNLETNVLALNAPCQFTFEGNTYYSAEQAIRAKQAELFKDNKALEKILACQSYAEFTQAHIEIPTFNDMLWRLFNLPVLLNVNFAKFAQNPSLRNYLLSTSHQVLIFSQDNDKLLGISNATEPNLLDPQQWEGDNLLGRALMEVRQELITTMEHLPLCSNYQDFAQRT